MKTKPISLFLEAYWVACWLHERALARTERSNSDECWDERLLAAYHEAVLRRELRKHDVDIYGLQEDAAWVARHGRRLVSA